MHRKQYHVYIMTNHSRTLYTGVTGDLRQRVDQHQLKRTPGFASKYRIDLLVYYESTDDVRAAIAREKQIKGWLRHKKVELIESVNPDWGDLSAQWRADDGDPSRSLRMTASAPCAVETKSAS